MDFSTECQAGRIVDYLRSLNRRSALPGGAMQALCASLGAVSTAAALPKSFGQGLNCW